MIHGYSALRCGLIGEHLGHSFSKIIHAHLCDYSYEHVELTPEQVESFVRGGTLDAYNVTIPYKKTVMPLLDVISREAQAIGAVNTVVRRDGKLYGYNTDYFGFCYMLDSAGFDVSGKKVIVLGTGGAAATVCAVLRDRHASTVSVSHRDNTPEFLAKHADARIIVNTTPVGMYPKNGLSPVDLDVFPRCEGVLDLIYNPSLTKLLLDAEQRDIKYVNGLPMLVAQAVRACELFTGEVAEVGVCERVCERIERQTKNRVLIGMPGCGKSTVGRLIAQMLDRPFWDADRAFSDKYGESPAEVIKRDGEDKFRQMEHAVLAELGKRRGAVIACGGGAVTRVQNYAPLHQNGVIVFLERALENLSSKGRPLSQATSVDELYRSRIDAYRSFADVTVASTEVPPLTAELIIKTLKMEKKQI